MNESNIRKYLSVIERAVGLIKEELDKQDPSNLLDILMGDNQEYKEFLQSKHGRKIPQTTPVEEIVESKKETAKNSADKAYEEYLVRRKKHVNDLMSIDCWPVAIPTHFLSEDGVISDADHINRAEAVLNLLVDRSVDGLKFVDYGCGDGWVASAMSRRGVEECFGFDIVESQKWSLFQSVQFTSNVNDLPQNYFDMVLLNDVLDHCEDPISVMKHVKSICKPNASIYVKCHPYTSKSGMHLYLNGINKAYMHLFLKPEELKELAQGELMYTRFEKNPLEAYQEWFKDFEILKSCPIKQPTGPFFHVESFKNLISDENKIDPSEMDQFMEMMEIQFVDYWLKPKKT